MSSKARGLSSATSVLLHSVLQLDARKYFLGLHLSTSENCTLCAYARLERCQSLGYFVLCRLVGAARVSIGLPGVQTL
jgi:hypothetical protein